MCKLDSFSIYIATFTLIVLAILYTLVVSSGILHCVLPTCLWLYHLGKGHPGPYTTTKQLKAPQCVAGGFWAIILSRAAWKRSWVGGDPAQSKMAMDRIVAMTGIVAWAQLLTA